MFKKYGEATKCRVEDSSSCVPLINETILNEFKKTAKELKILAPSSEDFLYFSTVMMHAAEASAINDDGSPKLTRTGEAVKVGWDTSDNTWKWTTNDPSVKPYKNCFTPETLISMADGTVKQIKDVQPGEFVISHTGNSRKVLRKFITPHNDKLVKISLSNGDSVTSTLNHKFYVPQTADARVLRSSKNVKYSFTEAKDLSRDTFFVSPNRKIVSDCELDPDKARLFGYFAAEGSFKKYKGKRNGICFTFNTNELNTYVKDTTKLLEKFYSKPRIKTRNNKQTVTDVLLTSTIAANEMFEFVGEYSKTKVISDKIVFNKNNEVKKQFLLGWMCGDGTVDKLSGKFAGITTSRNLAYQAKTMLDSLRVQNGIFDEAVKYSVRIPNTSLKKNFQTFDKINKFNKQLRKVNKSQFNSDYRYYTVRKIENIDYTGDVYNLEVEVDNTYLVGLAGVTVSNCNGDIFPEGELVKAHKQWISKPLCIDHKSSSVDHVRGYIVDTYYDRDLKRVVALCALDKKNYPDLAHKVAAGITPNVSMGTGVAAAVCTEPGCHKVARVEQDFCKHMKTKSGYGEINIGLNPIELSIVVNGADGKAKIKHIIAAANALNSYVEQKEQQFSKIADKVFSASLNFSDSNSGSSDNKSSNINFTTNSIEEFKKELTEALSKLEEICDEKKEAEEQLTEEDGNINESDSDTDFNIAAPGQKLASKELNSELTEANKLIASLETRLKNLENNFNKVLRDEMSDMKKQGYYQGTVEPTPGKPQYAKDPQNEKLREDGDKHMEVEDLGGPDGMHPGVKSVNMSELERKKLLARAEAEDRAVRRQAIVENAKKALGYFQGGGGVNEPTPGKTKYPADKTNVDLRDEDKHMNGQKPFPDVGNVEGLHPSPDSIKEKNELKRKEILQRAGLEGKFVKVVSADGKLDFNKTAWEVYNNGALILKASVNEISGGKSDLLFDSIATKEFGKNLISRIKVQGADSVSRLFKSAQEMAPPAQPAPAPAPSGQAPAEGSPEMPPMPEMGQAPAAEGDEKQDLSDPKDKALALSEEVRDKASDLNEAVKALTNENVEMGEADQMKQASFGLRRLQAQRKEINSELTEAFKTSLADLNDASKELDMIVKICERNVVSSKDSEFVQEVFDGAFDEAKQALVTASELCESFVKYARGSEKIVKQAQMESEHMAHDGEDEDVSSAIEDVLNKINEEHSEGSDLDDEDLEGHDLADAKDSDEDEEDCGDSNDAEDCDEDENDADITATKEEVSQGKVKANPGDKVTVKASLNTKEGRSAMRQKLASESVKFSPMLSDAHPKGGNKTLFKDVADGLGDVEDLEEQHEKVLEVAMALPKVKKEAEQINTLISEGQISEEDFPALIAEGVDKAAVEYWKKYYGESDKAGKEFADALTSEVKKSKASDELAEREVKIARAYELTYEMVARGLVSGDRNSIKEKVDELTQVNDQGFEAVKSLVASYKPVTKTASRLPANGYVDTFGERQEPDDLASQLSQALSGARKRMF